MAQTITSSAIRDRSTAAIASTNAASAAKSRAAVPSIELAADSAKPSSAATASGSSPSDEPASAPDPYGDTALRRSQSRSRSTSRRSAWACAARWWASSTGWACCRWVRPGIGASGCAAAWASSASTTSQIPEPTRRAASRSHIRKSVATWSLRDRPARSFPPSSAPARSTRPRSRAECTSSSSGAGPNAPEATSASSFSRADSMPASSSSVSSPARCSTRACAIDARRS